MHDPIPRSHAVALISMIHHRERGEAIDLIAELSRRDDLADLAMAVGELAASLCNLAAELVHALDYPDTNAQDQVEEATVSTLAERILESYGLAAARARTAST